MFNNLNPAGRPQPSSPHTSFVLDRYASRELEFIRVDALIRSERVAAAAFVAEAAMTFKEALEVVEQEKSASSPDSAARSRYLMGAYVETAYRLIRGV